MHALNLIKSQPTKNEIAFSTEKTDYRLKKKRLLSNTDFYDLRIKRAPEIMVLVIYFFLIICC